MFFISFRIQFFFCRFKVFTKIYRYKIFHFLISQDFNQSRLIIILCNVCYYHVTYAFQSESTLHSYLNVKELLAPNRRNIWNLSDYNRTQTHNQLVRKRTLNHLAKLTKWLSCIVSTYLYGAFDCSSRHVTYLFQSESTLCSCLNIKELLAWNRSDIWNLSECNKTQTHNHLLRKQTFNHLAKLAPVWSKGFLTFRQL